MSADVEIIEGPRSRAMRVSAETMAIVAAWSGALYDPEVFALRVVTSMGVLNARAGSYVVCLPDGSLDVMSANTLAWYFDYQQRLGG